MVRAEGADKRSTARFLAYGVNGLAVALMVVVFASTAGLTGAEVGIAGGERRPRAEAARGGLRRPGAAHPGRAGAPQARDAGPRPARRGAQPLPRPARQPRHRPGDGRPRPQRGAGGGRPAVRRRCASAVATPTRLEPDVDRVLCRGRKLTSLLDGAKRLCLGAPTWVTGSRLSGGPARPPGVASTTGWSTTPTPRRDRVATRLGLTAEHTVVAIAGATGSGKSSTFNALAGVELSSVGVRRPTTSWATACVWGREGADRAARVARHRAAPPDHARLAARPRQGGPGPAGRRPARPARPRLDRGLPPPRGRPADRAHRPDGVGARPAEVRRRRRSTTATSRRWRPTRT